MTEVAGNTLSFDKWESWQVEKKNRWDREATRQKKKISFYFHFVTTLLWLWRSLCPDKPHAQWSTTAVLNCSLLPNAAHTHTRTHSDTLHCLQSFLIMKTARYTTIIWGQRSGILLNSLHCTWWPFFLPHKELSDPDISSTKVKRCHSVEIWHLSVGETP